MSSLFVETAIGDSAGLASELAGPSRAAALLAKAARPLVLVGARTVNPPATAAVRSMLTATGLPVVETLRAAGVAPREVRGQYLGRLGAHDSASTALAEADVVLSIGFDTVGFDPATFQTSARIIHLDDAPLRVSGYRPELHVRGPIAGAIASLQGDLTPRAVNEQWTSRVAALRGLLDDVEAEPWSHVAPTGSVHPATAVALMRNILDDDDTLISDLGPDDLVVARHFPVAEPGRLLWAGLKTPGTRSPRAVAVGVAHPGTRVVILSGAGGSLLSTNELEAARRLRVPLTHVILRDSAQQTSGIENILNNGRSGSGRLTTIDVQHFAASFGARGRPADSLDSFEDALRESLRGGGVSVIDVCVS